MVESFSHSSISYLTFGFMLREGTVIISTFLQLVSSSCGAALFYALPW